MAEITIKITDVLDDAGKPNGQVNIASSFDPPFAKDATVADLSTAQVAGLSILQNLAGEASEIGSIVVNGQPTEDLPLTDGGEN